MLHRQSVFLCWLNRPKIRWNQSVGQSFSALSASSLEYVSAVSSSHSLSEAVLFFSLSLLRLVSSEHLVHLLNLIVSGHEYPDVFRKRVACLHC